MRVPLYARPWIAGGVGALLLLLLAILQMGSWKHQTRAAAGLFHHVFTGARASEAWRPLGGTWEVTDAGIRDDSNDRGAKLIHDAPQQSDISIEGNIMLQSLSGYASDAGFLLRTNSEEEGVYAYYGYYALLHRVKDHPAVFIIGRAGQGPYDLAIGEIPSGLSTQTWYHVKFIAVGCRLVATLQLLGSTQQAQAIEARDPDCIASGRAGLTSSHAGGEWRDVQIEPATAHDLQAAQALVVTKSSSTHAADRSSGIQALDGADPEPAFHPHPEQVGTISKAALWALIHPQRLSITGQVNLLSPELIVQDSSGGIVIHTATRFPLKIGDEVSVTGDASTDGDRPVLRNASVHVLWQGQPVPATSVTASRLATAEYDGQYVEIEGTLMGRQMLSKDVVRLEFSAEPQRFQAIVPVVHDSDPTQRIQLGSSVRFRGVVTRDARFLDNGVAFGVLVRSGNELQVTAGAPWWTPRNLLLLACLLIVTLVAIGLAYRRIERSKLLAVVQERERLAYEMHDTLAQSVAGIGFQLEAIRATLPNDLLVLREQITLAQDLVRHSHAEARTSIAVLHPQQLQRYGLLPGLEDCARRLVGASSIAVHTEVRGNVRQVSMRVTDALFRIGQEAIANAVRHASPTRLSVMLDYCERQLVFSVRDDGIGFDHAPEGQTLGLMGMQRRAEDIAAGFVITSLPGEGTTVSITVPLGRYSSLDYWRRILHLSQSTI